MSKLTLLIASIRQALINMRTTFTIVLTMICGLLLSQPLERHKSCEEEIKQANDDAKAGILRSISHGLVISTKGFEFERFSENFMLAKYGIESFNAGCIILGNEECYSDQMHKLILDKFGSDFYQRAKDLIEKEYEAFKNLDQDQKRQYINFDYIYERADKRAEYSKGQQELYREIHKRIDLSRLDFSRDHRVIGIYLVIGQSGTIDECKVVSKDFPRIQGEKVEKIIRELGNWNPANIYGFNVKYKIMLGLPLRFE